MSKRLLSMSFYDRLEYARQALARWRNAPEVFSVSDYHAVARRAWFHPWGCAVWRDRLAPTFSRWPGPDDLAIFSRPFHALARAL